MAMPEASSLARLNKIAKSGSIDDLYDLLRDCPILLNNLYEINYVTTPVHIAVENDNCEILTQLLGCKPLWGKILDTQGHTPLHLAVIQGREKMVHRIVMFSPDLIRVPAGRERLTPLHLACRENFVYMISEFLYLCPSSIQDISIRNESALHIAIQFGHIDAFKVLIGFLERSGDDEILNWKDMEGNNFLHVAATLNNFEAISVVTETRLRRKLINPLINHLNGEGNTPLDILHLNVHPNKEAIQRLSHARGKRSHSLKGQKIFHEFLTTSKGISEKLQRNANSVSSDYRNAILVIAVLIATANFKAIIQPPLIVTSADKTIYGSKEIFFLMNTLSFIASLFMIRLTVPMHTFGSMLLSILLGLFLTTYFIASIGMILRD